MLKKKGVPSDDFIVFVYDDIARSYLNPYPEKMYKNCQVSDSLRIWISHNVLSGGYDVDPRCAKDYTG